jgi:cellulose biosynthesis protein BcsQ
MPVITKGAKRIVFFNHKGGVGKTTLTVNLAHALLAAGKSVLLVDTDPQCSLSSFYLEENFLDKMLDESESDEGNTLWSALRPVSEGTGKAKRIEAVKIRDNLHLAVGDIRLSHFENSLADCWNLCLSRNRRGYFCTTSLSNVVDRLISNTKADFVLFDAGPNIGPLNRAMILDCTHFIVPAACDLFSSRALKTLGFALSEWVTTWERVKEMAPDGTPLLTGTPNLMGYVPQSFRVYRGEMVESSLQVLSKLESRIIDFVWKPLQLAYGLPTKERPAKLKLAEVKFFGALVTEAQTQGVPLWEVTGGSTAGKHEARRVFSEFARVVLAHTA